MFILSVILDDVKIAILTAIRTLFLDLCTVIYKLIVYIMDIFFQLGEAKLLSDTTIQGIYTRVGLILGLFMIFRLTFAAIEYLINPDTMLDKQKGAGNLIKKVLIVVVLLGSTQFLFEKAYDIQHLLVEDNIIAKVILQKNVSAADDAGSELAYQLFSAFYVYDDNAPNTAENEFCRKLTEYESTTGEEVSESRLRKQFKESPPNLNDVYYCIALTYEGKTDYEEETMDKYVINFSGLLATAVGVVVLWTLMTYTVQVGVRAIQLAYLQLIAPIPIMSYLMPKGDDILKKWGMQCLTTFLDFFIRMAILYFVVLIIQELDVQLNTIEYTGDWALGTIYLRVVIIIALLIFAKKVPELLKEIFPSMGGSAGLSFDFGLKSLKSTATFGAGAALGAVAGAATGIKYGKGTAGGRLGGALTGLARGAVGGAKTKGNVLGNVGKGMGSQRAAMQRAYNRNNDGSSFWGRTFGAGDAARTKAAYDEELSLYDAYEQNTKVIDAELEKNAIVQSAMAKKQAIMDRVQAGGAAPTVAEIRNADAAIKQAKKTALQVEIGRGPTGKLKAALDNAEAIRAKGITSGYDGFGTNSISTGTAQERADAYFDNKDSAQGETRNIKDPAGTRNKDYKEAEANAKYARDK